MEAHKNNIGFLRLIFASLVIIGHAPEMMDGDRAREPLTVIFHTVSLGDLSVDAFFLLSGYLITKSMVGTGSIPAYLTRRAMRIYPAFIVAYLISVFVLGTLVHAQPWLEIPKTLFRLVTLKDPTSYPGQFPGMQSYPALNGSMWTIAYEFRCYLLIAIFWACGLLSRRRAVLALTAFGIAWSILTTFPLFQAPLSRLGAVTLAQWSIGNPLETVRLTTIFLIGTCFFLFRDEIGPHLSAKAAIACGALAAALMYRDPHFAELAMVTFGAVTLFWMAFRMRLGRLQRVNDSWDISYGVYLYGWPIATYIRWIEPSISPWVLAAVTLPLAFLCGAASWWGLERWAKDWGRGRRNTRQEVEKLAQ